MSNTDGHPAIDWKGWHAIYDRPSGVNSRLLAVQKAIRECLALLPAGPVSLLSIFAGDGRDLVPVVAESVRRNEVRCLFIENDEALVRAGRQRVKAHALSDRMEFRCADATSAESYIGSVPVHFVLAAGVFGNLLPEDIVPCVKALTGMLKTGGFLVWTRSRHAGDGESGIAKIQAALQDQGFVERNSGGSAKFLVASHQFLGNTTQLVDRRLFTFTPFS